METLNLILTCCCLAGIVMILVERKPKRRAKVTKSVTATEMVQQHQERHDPIRKPVQSWTRAKQRLEDVYAPEKREAQVMEAHKEIR